MAHPKMAHWPRRANGAGVAAPSTWERMLLPHPRVSGQVWVHSCCSLARLELALASREVTAIESDIIMAESGVPIMAHPPARSSDLTFERFLDLVLADGAKHLKLDFKVLEAVEPCLLMLAEVEEQLRQNEQVTALRRQALGAACRVHRGPAIRPADHAIFPRRRCGSTRTWLLGPTTGGPESSFQPQTSCLCAAACAPLRSFRSAGWWHLLARRRPTPRRMRGACSASA